MDKTPAERLLERMSAIPRSPLHSIHYSWKEKNTGWALSSLFVCEAADQYSRQQNPCLDYTSRAKWAVETVCPQCPYRLYRLHRSCSSAGISRPGIKMEEITLPNGKLSQVLVIGERHE